MPTIEKCINIQLAAASVNGPGPERNRLGLTSDGRKAETDRNPLHGPVSWDGGE